ncbi:MAG TPA: fumarylacetoacetate hydrolase family protein [Candidatus Limnocylindrales bacterium]|nr:fumarylacetoacetate hydrolase family protein [Candidatus Limnocylindrales bacterium]
MRIARFDGGRIGLIEEGAIRDISPVLVGWRPDAAYMNDFIAHFDELRPTIATYAASVAPQALEEVRLEAPVPRPTQLLAAPLNFQAHRDEMKGPLTAGAGTAAELGFFVKAAGSIAGPSDDVLLPDLPDRRFDFEGEIAVVVGRAARAVPAERVLDHVLGYTILFDMTMRMTETAREERTMRKSFATFSPLGPWIVTRDEIPDPSRLGLKVWRNGELRQDASLRDLIVDIPNLLARASAVLELQPGDVYTTGSPAGVGQVHVGDEIEADAPLIGRLRLRVAQRPW